MGRLFNTTISIDGARLRLVVEGEIDLDTASELLDMIKTAVRCDVLGVDIDLSGVTSVDPTCLHVLVEGERARHAAATRRSGIGATFGFAGPRAPPMWLCGPPGWTGTSTSSRTRHSQPCSCLRLSARPRPRLHGPGRTG